MKYFSILFMVLLLLLACTADEATYDYNLQGHRGARGLLPGNTIPGFLKAVEYGVDTIEMDLVVTADGELLVSHEPWFSHQISTKPNGEPVTEEEQMQLNIFEMTYKNTQQFDVGMRGHPAFPGQEPMEATKPLLRQAISAIEAYVRDYGVDPVFYNIETKSNPDWYGEYVPQPEEFAQILYDELTELGILDRVIVQSFDPATLIFMREIDPDVDQAMLVYEKDQTIETYTEHLGYQPDIWSPNYELVTQDLIEEAHSIDMKIIPWTVNEADEMVRLLEMGVDGIITDYPNRAP